MHVWLLLFAVLITVGIVVAIRNKKKGKSSSGASGAGVPRADTEHHGPYSDLLEKCNRLSSYGLALKFLGVPFILAGVALIWMGVIRISNWTSAAALFAPGVSALINGVLFEFFGEYISATGLSGKALADIAQNTAIMAKNVDEPKQSTPEIPHQ